MRIAIIMTLISIFIYQNLSGQTRTIYGRVISEDLETLPKVRIQNKDTLLLGETDLDGRFKICIPRETDKLLLSWIGMEFTTIKLQNGCDTIEVIMMYDAIYDFMSSRKIDRLRLKRFEKLPKLHQLAYVKGLFSTRQPCFEQDFKKIKPQLDEIKKRINE